MTEPDYLQAAAALFSAFAWQKVVPLVALVIMLALVGWLLVKAQAKEGFNIEQMFLDENGKASASRVIAFFAFGISSWDLMSARVSDKASEVQFFYYLAAWSGALVFVKFADKWDGSMPFGNRKP